MIEVKKPPISARERSALATKRAKKHPWHVWHANGFQEAENLAKRMWKFGGGRSERRTGR